VPLVVVIAATDACGFSGTLVRIDPRKLNTGLAAMNRWAIRWVALGGFLMVGAELQAHHAVAGVYDLNKEIVVQGELTKLNFVNPHASLHLAVPNPDGTTTEWVLTTASIQVLTRAGVNRSSIKVGEILKITALPARNGNPAGFIRRLELGDREISLFDDNGPN
jgi:DNA/RNA endonuclease YhcR with UshA esterase domain